MDQLAKALNILQTQNLSLISGTHTEVGRVLTPQGCPLRAHTHITQVEFTTKPHSPGGSCTGNLPKSHDPDPHSSGFLLLLFSTHKIHILFDTRELSSTVSKSRATKARKQG